MKEKTLEAATRDALEEAGKNMKEMTAQLMKEKEAVTDLSKKVTSFEKLIIAGIETMKADELTFIVGNARELMGEIKMLGKMLIPREKDLYKMAKTHLLTLTKSLEDVIKILEKYITTKRAATSNKH